MRKVLFVCMILCFILCGCQNKENPDALEYQDELSKAQEITVVSEDTSNVTKTITKDKDLKKFVNTLDLEHWRLGELPDDAKKTGTFGFSQEQTIKFGETKPDEKLYDVCEITTYDQPYIDLEMGDIHMVFQITEETLDDLNDYF